MEDNLALAKKAAEDYIKNMSPEQLAEIKAGITKAYEELAAKHRDELNSLTSKQTDLKQKISAIWEIETKNQDYTLKSGYMEQRSALKKQVDELEFKILNKKNILTVLTNGGDLANFTDKKGLRHEDLPDFERIDTTLITFEEETILTDPLPPYVPVIDEEMFRRKGYIFDAIRSEKNRYLLAPAGFSEDGKNTMMFVLVTLDQLVLINQYYLTKAKAILQKEADARSVRSEQYYDKLPVAQRERHFAQKNYYRSVPATVKKKVTQEQWEALDLEGKEKLYKPFKKYGTKRLLSKLSDNEMWISFHEMYERFVDPTALPMDKQGNPIELGKSRFGAFGNRAIFAYWHWFRDMMKWKIKDLAIQREANSEIRKIAMETSFGDSNTNDILRPEYGILVKRQNGSEINAAEVDDIKTAWALILSKIGNIKYVADADSLKISHTGEKYVFASKASGMFIPQMRTIAVTKKHGEAAFSNIMAHEVAHYIDFKLGERLKRRFYSDDFESDAGDIAMTFRRNMNAQTESDYLNATKECFARAIEQYFAIETFGPEVTLMYNVLPSANIPYRKYTLEDAYVSLDTYNNIMRPKITAFIANNSGFFGEVVLTPDIKLPENPLPSSEVEIPVELKSETEIQTEIQTPTPSEIKQIEKSAMPETDTSYISKHKSDVKKIYNGELSLEDYKAAFDRLSAHKEEILKELSSKTKDSLLAEMSGQGKYRYKNEKKDVIVKALYKSFFDDFIYDTVSYGHGEKYEDVIASKVKNADQAYLDAYAKMVKEHREDSAKRNAEIKKAFDNPETIEEFRTLIDYKGKEAISKLSPEKQELYDELISGKTKEIRAKEAAHKAVVASVDLGNTEMTLIETKHTRDGHDLFVVKLSNKVEKDTYNDLNIKAKRLGGYYSSYNKGGAIPGFQFKTKEAAEKFMSLKEGDVDNSDTIEQRQEEQKAKTVEKLNEIAENAIENAEEKLNRERKINTSRRAAMATHADETALKEKQIAGTLKNIAEAIASGQATHLDGIKSKSHVELLDQLVSNAKNKELNAKYPNYTDYLAHKGEPATTETIGFLTSGVFPKIYKENIQRLINDVKNKSGMKLVSARWQKRIDADKTQNYIIPGTKDLMNELADMSNTAGLKSYDVIKSQIDDYKRLIAMGIENDSMLRAALREFIKFREGKGEIDTVKQLERAATGKKLGIDFFPTPKDVAAEMVLKAGIKPGMDVLEPSAGNGNIAEVIRSFGVTPDVIEISEELRKILEAKGFNLVGSDFLATDFGDKKYDRIIMNPPFSNSQDIKHVSFAYDLLKPGGRIVAIMGEGAFIRSDRQATEFREWLEENGGVEEPLPQNTFKDSSLMNTTGANARVVVIDKPIDKTIETPTPMETATSQLSHNAENYLKIIKNNYPDSYTYDTTKPSSDVNQGVSELLNEGYVRMGSYKDGFREVILNDEYIPEDKKHLKSIEVKPEPTGPKLFTQTGSNVINGSTINNWNEIPSVWKNMNSVKEVKYINSPYDKGLINIVKPFLGADTLRPNMTAINFDSNGITATDAHKLIHLPYPNPKFIGLYNTGPNAAKIKSLYPNSDFKGDLFTGKYPNYEVVIPKSDHPDYTAFECDIYKLLQYNKAGQKFCNPHTHQIIFKYKDSAIGLNSEFLIDILESALKLGHEKLYAFIGPNNRAVIFSPDKNYTVGKSEIFLLMPVMIMVENPSLGAHDYDFDRHLNVYYDFTDNQIHNADGSKATFQMNYGEYSLLSQEQIKLLAEFKKSSAKNYIPVLENFAVKNKEIHAFNLVQQFILKNIDLSDGLYTVIDGAIEFNPFGNLDEFADMSAVEATNKTALFSIPSGVFDYYLDKALEFTDNDDLRPHMNTYNINHVDGKTFLVATNMHILFKAEITDYVKILKDGDFSVLIHKPLLNKYMDLLSNDTVTVYSSKEFIILETSETEFYTKVEGNKYPQYDQVIPSKNTKELTINIKDLYNCIKSPEAIAFLKKKRGKYTIPNIYDKVGPDGRLEIYLGTFDKDKLEEEIKICDVNYTYEEKETKPQSSLLLIMPVMYSVGVHFMFGYHLFKELLDTCSSEDFILQYTEKNRAYVVPGDSFTYNQTVKRPAVVPVPKIIKDIPEEDVTDSVSEIETQIELLEETLPMLKGSAKKEVKETIELLKESLELLKVV